MVYTLEIRKDEDGNFCVDVPAIQGCCTYGRTWEEALENAEEVILLCLEDMAKDGDAPPPDLDPVSVRMDDSSEVILYRLAVPEAVPSA